MLFNAKVMAAQKQQLLLALWQLCRTHYLVLHSYLCSVVVSGVLSDRSCIMFQHMLLMTS
jgi:hypothetical protein